MLPDDYKGCPHCGCPIFRMMDYCDNCDDHARARLGLDENYLNKDGKDRYGLAMAWLANNVRRMRARYN